MNNLSLRKLSIIIFVLLLLLSSVFAFSTIRLSRQVSQIQDSWSSFKSQNNEKARLINSLNAVLGYGGMIHNFKNYVLRKDFEHFVKAERSMGAAQEVVRQYIALSSTPAEKLVLNDIQTMLNSYQQSLEYIRLEISKGSQSAEIDSRVKYDDELAFRGLKVLSDEIKAEHDYFRNEQNKPVLSASIRVELGYGGMIHAFKNYILRNDEKYKQKALSSMSSIEQAITKYLQLNPTTGEKTALQDIRSVLAKYKSNIELIDQAILKKHTAEEIDNQVKINDRYALRGLRAIDQDILNEIDKKSERLSSMLLDISQHERLNAVIFISSTIVIAIFIFWVFSRKIINPVRKISEVMIQMTHGNLEVQLEDPDKQKYENTELGKMANALQVFKEHEIDRRVIEEENRRLALTDPLTGLANRNQFEKKYHEMIALAKREQKCLTMLAIDLDDFKPVNDDYGHAAGDLVLVSVAKNLLRTFRETDLVARLGGDEFSVIMYGSENIDGIIKTVERLIAIIPAPVPFGKDILSVGVSIGIAQHLHGSDESLDLLMHNADTALYQAKNMGKNTFAVYSAD